MLNFGNKLTRKPLFVYPHKIIKDMKLIAFNKDEVPEPFGSYIYRLQKYPGDIDLIENVTKCKNKKACTLKKITKEIAETLQNIVKDVLNKEDYYYSEIKAGLDIRYLFFLGEMKNGYLIKDKYLKQNIERLNKQQLLTKQEYKVCKKIINKSSIYQDDFDVLNYIIRQHLILRWTADEILKGEKVLFGPDKKIIKLQNAFYYNTLTKIDIITIFNGHFFEITNIYDIGYIKNGKTIFVHTATGEDFLPFDIERFWYSNMFYNPFKVIKRIFSYARIRYKNAKNNWEKEEYGYILQQIIPIVSSNIGILSQMKSELDAITILLNKFKNPSPEKINNQVDFMRSNLNNVLKLNDKDLKFFSDHINKFLDAKNNNEKLKELNILKAFLVNFINFFTVKALDSIHLNFDLLWPSESLVSYLNENKIRIYILLGNLHTKTYDHSIKRSPISLPKNPLEKYFKK